MASSPSHYHILRLLRNTIHRCQVWPLFSSSSCSCSVSHHQYSPTLQHPIINPAPLTPLLHISQSSARQRRPHHRLQQAGPRRNGPSTPVPQLRPPACPARGAASDTPQHNRVRSVGLWRVGGHQRGCESPGAAVADPDRITDGSGGSSGGPHPRRHGGRSLARHHRRLQRLVRRASPHALSSWCRAFPRGLLCRAVASRRGSACSRHPFLDVDGWMDCRWM